MFVDVYTTTAITLSVAVMVAAIMINKNEEHKNIKE